MAVAQWFEKRTVSVRQDGFTSESPIFTFQREVECGRNPDYAALRDVLAIARRNPSMTLGDMHAEYIKRTV